jgi:hypothetical protein
LPKDLQGLIRKMATENPTWGEQRIANELKLKLGIRVSARTVEKYLRIGGPATLQAPPAHVARPRLQAGQVVRSGPVIGGLHLEC